MERAGKELKQKVVSRLSRAALFCSLLSPVTRLQASPGSDFLVVENVSRLLVYNKYQQAATEKEQALLTAFAPMRILKADDVLGDEFTRCMRVAIGREVFFLLKDKDGKLSRSGPLGFERTFSNASDLLDTIQILAGSSLRLSPMGSAVRRLSTGEKVFRIFRHQGATYGQTLGVQPTYGWINFGGTKANRDWKVLKTVRRTDRTIPPELVRRIETRINDVNHLFAKLFDHFNTETNQQKPIPRWNIEASGEAIRCTLLGTSPADDFRQSSLLLARDIESILMGTDLRVSHAPGKIEVR